ncbi:MAG: V-type ATP synthase subunit E [Bacillota bacterium]
MNDGKIIIDKIIAMADKEVKVIESQAKKEVDAIIKATNDKESKKEEKLEQMMQHVGDELKAKEISSADLDSKVMLLECKQGILNGIISEAKKRLVSLSDAEYTKVVGDMLSALDSSVGKDIIVSAKDAKILADVIKEKGFSLSDETRDIDGGFIVKNNEVEYNYSFESILAIEEDEIRQTIASILF